MTLELRPNCEMCDVDLPPESPDARICTYECTFCARCVDERLSNVCPNCGGGFAPRPIRPVGEWRPGLCLAKQPPSTRRRSMRYTPEEVESFVAQLEATPPGSR